MLLAHCTWPEVEAYLERSGGIILPIGSTEQHGPSGAMGTDALSADLVARGVGEATGAMVAPTLAFGMARHHMAFAGTMTLQPETLKTVLVDLLDSLEQHGFTHCLVLNGHGGNVGSVRAAFDQRAAERPNATLRSRLRNWWSPPGVAALASELFGDRDGAHATASEISLVQWAVPGTVRQVVLGPAPPSSGFGDAADFRRRYPDGRMGSDPSLADPAHGKRLYEAAVAGLAEDFRDFVGDAGTA